MCAFVCLFLFVVIADGVPVLVYCCFPAAYMIVCVCRCLLVGSVSGCSIIIYIYTCMFVVAVVFMFSCVLNCVFVFLLLGGVLCAVVFVVCCVLFAFVVYVCLFGLFVLMCPACV